MANYSVTYACGHTIEKQLYGKTEDRQRYIAWAAKSGNCPACAKADKAAVVADMEAEHGLSSLSGSEKQITWARSIRAEKINAIVDWFASVAARVPVDKTEAFADQVALGWQLIAAQSTAGWWIDNRDVAGQTIVEKLYKEARK